MKPERGILWGLYSAGVAALAAVITHKAVNKGWELVTGEEPPEPNDPTVPAREALLWVLASAIGIGLGQVFANRFAAQRWEAFTGSPPPSIKHVNMKL